MSSTDSEVLYIINTEVDGAIDRSFNILRTRIDRFGTSQPNIQKLQGTGRIQIELPGVDNPERVRKLLQGVAKLEFWEVYEMNELGQILQKMNQVAVKEMIDLAPQMDAENIRAENSLEDLSSLLTDNDATNEGISDPDQVTAPSEEVDSTLALLDSLNNSNVSPLFSLLQAQYGLIYQVKDTSRINRVLQNPSVSAVIPATMKFLWLVKPIDT